ncbi:hypothetical protein D2T29_19650 [Sinirhodobacter populi]|uniref:Head decoration protein n=1 Tax=Paenirhodobacter populi TaxID=2306993 RepID=A0A443K222_9RHOB|nr:hypothetical protein [Sinirhodobacter populi]RWR26794.1 hypothetical protein D2T29_19650 [Sinirhodobacter populi]
MAALTANRNTPQLYDPAPATRRGKLAAAQVIYAGALVMRNAAGFLVKGATATGLVGAGRAEFYVSNAGGAAGDAELDFAPGVFRFDNSAAADAITDADIGAACYAVDDQTVAKTSGTNTRSPAGVVELVDADGVWVRLDAALTKAALS